MGGLSTSTLTAERGDGGRGTCRVSVSSAVRRTSWSVVPPKVVAKNTLPTVPEFYNKSYFQNKWISSKFVWFLKLPLLTGSKEKLFSSRPNMLLRRFVSVTFPILFLVFRVIKRSTKNLFFLVINLLR